MSGKYSQIALIGIFDLATGTAIAKVMSAIFGKEEPPSKPTFSQLSYLLFSIIIQAVLTLWVAVEVHDVFLGQSFEDPTGGILLIVSLFRQPNFWVKVNSAADTISDMIVCLFSPNSEAESGGNPKEFIDRG